MPLTGFCRFFFRLNGLVKWHAWTQIHIRIPFLQPVQWVGGTSSSGHAIWFSKPALGSLEMNAAETSIERYKSVIIPGHENARLSVRKERRLNNGESKMYRIHLHNLYAFMICSATHFSRRKRSPILFVCFGHPCFFVRNRGICDGRKVSFLIGAKSVHKQPKYWHKTMKAHLAQGAADKTTHAH